MPEYGEAAAENTVARVINSSWPGLDAATSTRLAKDMIATRNTEGLVGSLPWNDWAQHMGEAVSPLARQVGRSIGSQMQQFQSVVGKLSFTNTDAVSVKYAQQEGAKLIANLQDSQRASIRLVMGQALNGEHTVDQAARMIRGSIGLHPAWAQAVVTFREKQLGQLSRSGLSYAKATALADKRASTYQDRLIRRRAMNIARTEIQTASNLGRYASWTQMIGNGLASPQSMKEWSAGPGACNICSALAGQQVRWDDVFDGGYVMPPAHTNCRCSAVLIPQLYSNPILNPRPIDWTNPVLPGRAQLDAIGMGGDMSGVEALTPDAGFAFDEPAPILVPVAEPVIEPAVNPFELTPSEAASVISRAARASTSEEASIDLEDYTDASYRSLNEELRSRPLVGAQPLTPDTLRITRHLDSLIQSQAPLDHPITVYRGGFDAFNAQPGMIVMDRGYVSTSVNRYVGEKFSENGMLMEIRVPSGFRGMTPRITTNNMSAAQVQRGEGEFILPRDSGMTVVSVKQEVIDGRAVKHIVMEVTSW